MPSPSQNFTRRVYHGDPGGERAHPYRADPPVAALEAAAIFTAAVALFILVGALAGGGLDALAAAQLAGLAGVPIVWAIARGDAAARLGVNAPPWRALAGAALVGVSFWYANVRIAEPIVRALDNGEVARLDQTLASPPLAVRLLVVAALPALCEELLTRGVLARAIRPAIGRVLAVALSALVFAAFHLSLVRFVPTFLLGALLASITLAADSVWPAVLAHFLNNAIAIAIAGGDLAPIASIVSAHPDLSLGASLALSTLGLVIALAPRRPV